jgi:hypothetical protein
MNKHSQYCSSGDMTLEGIHMAVRGGKGKNEGRREDWEKGGLGGGSVGNRE